jgi:predicted ABC-class ATPase
MFPAKRKVEDEAFPSHIRERIPMAESIDPLNEYGKFGVYAKEVYRLNFGKQVIDLTDVEQLIELSQTKALGYAVEYAKKYIDRKTTLREVVHRVIADIDENGIDVMSKKISGHFAWFRGLELAFTINRLRGLEVIQQDLE